MWLLRFARDFGFATKSARITTQTERIDESTKIQSHRFPQKSPQIQRTNRHKPQSAKPKRAKNIAALNAGRGDFGGAWDSLWDF